MPKTVPSFGAQIKPGERPVTNRIRAAAADRHAIAVGVDVGLSLADIEQDEATRSYVNARAGRRALAARRRRGQRRFNRLTMRELVEQVRTTPGPSRGARRLAERLVKETS